MAPKQRIAVVTCFVLSYKTCGRLPGSDAPAARTSPKPVVWLDKSGSSWSEHSVLGRGEVTGSNKGIGYAVVRGLAEQFDGLIYLTSRNEQLGQESLNKLKSELTKEGGAKADEKVRYHQLDITDQSSIQKLRDTIQKEHGGKLDVLVNNAGIAYKKSSTAPFSEQAKVTSDTNYFGTQSVCHALFPLLAEHARVVNVASRAGTITLGKLSVEKQTMMKDRNLTEAKLDDIIRQFISYAEKDENDVDVHDEGWGKSAYGFGKLAEIALTNIQQKEMDAKRPNDDILINSCCPGYVDTDMTSHRGFLTPDEGADTLIHLALLPPNTPETNPAGELVADRRVVDWQNNAAQSIWPFVIQTVWTKGKRLFGY